MTAALRPLVEGAFAAFEAKDLPTALGYFADDAVMIDPHYPTPTMRGQRAINDGLQWAFGALDRLSFTIVHFLAAEDGQTAAVETATAHVLPGGKTIRFTQTFVIETRAGQVVRLQAYTPYGPHGLAAIVLGLMRLGNEIRSRTGRSSKSATS